MIPLEQFRRFVFGSEATAPKAIWAEPTKETSSKAAGPGTSGLLKLRGFVGIFLVANICIGGYLIAKSTKKPSKRREKKKEKETAAPLVPQPVFVPPPQPQRIPQRKISVNEQRQLFTWMLDEKRKLKPSSKADKARIDEDKKVLKQFLRATNFPQL